METLSVLTTFVIFLICLPNFNNGILQRCYSCRSRGELGTCKDPFIFKEGERGIESVPCASGWCGKMLETENAQKEENGIATQRRCLQRGPSDNEERCAYTKIDQHQMYMCFCKGDLCNTSNVKSYSFILILSCLSTYLLSMY